MRARTALRGCAGLVCGLALFTACATRKNVSGGDDGVEPSPTAAPSIFYEEGSLVYFGVNTGLSRFGTDESLLAVEIGIASKSLPKLTVTPEGITLRGEGKNWPTAALTEREGHTLRADFERKLQPVRFRDVLELRFPEFRELAPNAGGSTDRSLARTVEMGRHTWLLAQVWFPHPGGDIKGRVFEVWLEAPELPDPVFTTVRF